jgi:hypothetical protein
MNVYFATLLVLMLFLCAAALSSVVILIIFLTEALSKIMNDKNK